MVVHSHREMGIKAIDSGSDLQEGNFFYRWGRNCVFLGILELHGYEGPETLGKWAYRMEGL